MTCASKINFPHDLLLRNRQAARLRKAFENRLTANIKSSKTQISKIVQSVEFLGKLFRQLMKIRLPLMKNALIPLATTAHAT